MDETTKPDLDEVLGHKANLMDPSAAQAKPECLTLTEEDHDLIKKMMAEEGGLKGHPKFEKVHTHNKVSKVFDVQPEEPMYTEMMKLSGLVGKTDHINARLNSCASWRKEEAYPDLPKGRLLYTQKESFDLDEEDKKKIAKEYITLRMKESRQEIEEILNQKGDVSHPVQIPHLEFNHDEVQKAISEAFPEESENGRFCKMLSKRLGMQAEFSRKTSKLLVKGVATKFDTRDLVGAVQALARVLPVKDAERLVVREVAKKIKAVL